MKDFKWPVALVYSVTLVVLGAMFGLTNDQSMQNKIIGLFDTIVPFLFGAVAGGATAGGAAYFIGRKRGIEDANAKKGV